MSFRSGIEKIEGLFKKTPTFASRGSAIMSNLASYSVVNGLIGFFAIRALCKYSQYEVVIGSIVSLLVAFLFALFLLDTFLNHIPLKEISGKSKSVPVRCFLYFIFIAVGILLNFTYTAGIYISLFNFSSQVLTCKL
ncbi:MULTISPECIES: hypothetical protein [Xenorhabdus]|uniref:hypothetical protein n=1 Tax=Xenorhabdus TaxID=626 RepID=UPI00064B0813|nr:MULTISPECIES: hypothetical protein [Xenorhabdus]KLU14904.1 hypothetical protein AAY47_13755 [Xenorhabdus griffiniae]KOP33257.1 hypothetical protein AFK69_10960 [Xenorhabdus sp. GDc328]